MKLRGTCPAASPHFRLQCFPPSTSCRPPPPLRTSTACQLRTQQHRRDASVGASPTCSPPASQGEEPGSRFNRQAACAETEINRDDSFLGFSPDFDSYPASGQLRPDWLLTLEANVPAGSGMADRPGFQMWQQQLQVQDRKLVLAGPANLNSVTFWYWRRGLKGMDPFWARPWPSGLALADLILREPELVRGKRILELGAGVGAPGIAAALAGAREVVITDREPLALQCAALSARACGLDARVNLPGASSSGSSSDGAREPSGSGNMGDSQQQEQQQQQCQVVCELLDWSQPVPEHLSGRFDLVLATDVLYEHLDVPMLAAVVGQLIGSTAPGTAGGEHPPQPVLQGQGNGRGGGGACGLLLAEYPHRYPANQRNFQLLMQAPPLALHLTRVSKELVRLPRFENEMLDIEMDRDDPQIHTDFLLFMQEPGQGR